MNIVIVLFTILLISSIGYAIIRGFGFFPSRDNLLAIACSYGLGVGLVAMQLYFYSRLNIPWQREFILYPWFIFIGGILVKNRNKLHFYLPKIPTLKLLDKILVLGILLTLGYVIFEALLRPVVVWDAWATWLLESKIFFIDGKLSPQVFNYLGSTYPLIVKLLGTFVYIMLGKVDDTAVLLTSCMFYASIALLLFAVIKKRYSLRYALLFTFLFVTIQNFVRHGGRLEAGIADLPLGYYSFICMLLVIEYIKKGNTKIFLLLNVFLGITQLVKVEGTFFVLTVEFLILYTIYKNKLYTHLYLLLFWILPQVDWQIYRKINGLQKNYFSVFGLGLSIDKTISSLSGTVKELLTIKSWNFLWIAYFYSLLVFGVRKNYEIMIINFFILSQFIIYMLIYIFTTGSSPESSIERLLIHIAPLAIYGVAIVTHTKLKK